MEVEGRIHHSDNRFPVAEARDGTAAVQLKGPDGRVIAVLLPKDASPEGAQRIADFLDQNVRALITQSFE
ncbi:hypothetical protein [Methylorubrum extorquens]